MRIKPAPGRKVRDPRSKQFLPDSGRDVPDNDMFWRRRIRDGDVIVEGAAGRPAAGAATPQQPAATRASTGS